MNIKQQLEELIEYYQALPLSTADAEDAAELLVLLERAVNVVTSYLYAYHLAKRSQNQKLEGK